MMNQNTFRCAVRVRPRLLREQDRTECVHIQKNTVLVEDPMTGDGREFVGLPQIIGPEADQADTAKRMEIDSLVDVVLRGYHATLIAYGQTGSGKTHTLLGEKTHQLDGLLPRCIQTLYEKRLLNAENTNSVPVKIRASFLEIANTSGQVNEVITDLLEPVQKTSLQIRYSNEQVPFVSDLTCVECDTVEDAICVLQEGAKYRRTSKTELNERSSRSHSIFTLYVESASGKLAKFQFVDLAGSERVKTSKAQGGQLQEAQSINKSLFTLAQVILALSGKETRSGHIPYRNSKLTELLSDAFGGNSYCLFITCISPVFAEESIHSLSYATRALHIENRPRKNVVSPTRNSSSSSNSQHAVHTNQHQLQSASNSRSSYLSHLTGTGTDGAIAPVGEQRRVVNMLQANMFYMMSEMLSNAARNLEEQVVAEVPVGPLPVAAAPGALPPRGTMLSHSASSQPGSVINSARGAAMNNLNNNPSVVNHMFVGVHSREPRDPPHATPVVSDSVFPPLITSSGTSSKGTNLVKSVHSVTEEQFHLGGGFAGSPAKKVDAVVNEEPYEEVVRRIRAEHERIETERRARNASSNSSSGATSSRLVSGVSARGKENEGGAPVNDALQQRPVPGPPPLPDEVAAASSGSCPPKAAPIPKRSGDAYSRPGRSRGSKPQSATSNSSRQSSRTQSKESNSYASRARAASRAAVGVANGGAPAANRELRAGGPSEEKTPSAASRPPVPSLRKKMPGRKSSNAETPEGKKKRPSYSSHRGRKLSGGSAVVEKHRKVQESMKVQPPEDGLKTPEVGVVANTDTEANGTAVPEESEKNLNSTRILGEVDLPLASPEVVDMHGPPVLPPAPLIDDETPAFLEENQNFPTFNKNIGPPLVEPSPTQLDGKINGVNVERVNHANEDTGSRRRGAPINIPEGSVSSQRSSFFHGLQLNPGDTLSAPRQSSEVKKEDTLEKDRVLVDDSALEDLPLRSTTRMSDLVEAEVKVNGSCVSNDVLRMQLPLPKEEINQELVASPDSKSLSTKPVSHLVAEILERRRIPPNNSPQTLAQLKNPTEIVPSEDSPIRINPRARGTSRADRGDVTMLPISNAKSMYPPQRQVVGSSSILASYVGQGYNNSVYDSLPKNNTKMNPLTAINTGEQSTTLAARLLRQQGIMNTRNNNSAAVSFLSPSKMQPPPGWQERNNANRQNAAPTGAAFPPSKLQAPRNYSAKSNYAPPPPPRVHSSLSDMQNLSDYDLRSLHQSQQELGLIPPPLANSNAKRLQFDLPDSPKINMRTSGNRPLHAQLSHRDYMDELEQLEEDQNRYDTASVPFSPVPDYETPRVPSSSSPNSKLADLGTNDLRRVDEYVSRIEERLARISEAVKTPITARNDLVSGGADGLVA
ncbi:unnamed protein product [Amoebophrya sp. A120]|nr:unnamed protein product [Amoebophrya sp. A120]|eukprot:GSA120T00003021001.1